MLKIIFVFLFFHFHQQFHRCLAENQNVVDDDSTDNNNIFENVHLIDRVGSNFVFRGSTPIDRRTEKFSFQMLQRTLHVTAQANHTKLPEVYRTLVINLIGLGQLDAENMANRCWFLREHNGKAVQARFDKDPEHNRAALACFEAAEKHGVSEHAAENHVQHNDFENCEMPTGWYALAYDRFLYYCNPIIRQMIQGHKLSKLKKPSKRAWHSDRLAEWLEKNATTSQGAKKRNTLIEDDDEIDDHNVDAPDSLAKKLYRNRHEKDLARMVSEWSFFANRDADDERWHMPLIGTHLDANILHKRQPELAKALAVSLRTWGTDRLVDRIERLNKLLKVQSHLPVVVYIHCEGGSDRTGEFAGAYELQSGKSWIEVIRRAHRFAKNGRLLEDNNFRSLQWYCFYLRYTDANASKLQCEKTQESIREEERREAGLYV